MKQIEHLKKWKRPANYMGADWPEYYVFLGRTRDSDELTNSNFEIAIQAVREVACDTVPGNPDNPPTVQLVSETHWACGWVEWIAIHESDQAALECADGLMERLNNYPILDEEDFSRRESEQADRVWKDCYNPKERVAYIRAHKSQFSFHDFTDLLESVRGKYFAGYASELIS